MVLTGDVAIGRGTVLPFVRTEELGILKVETDGVAMGRTGAVTAEGFPLAPTVVHALPGTGAATWVMVQH